MSSQSSDDSIHEPFRVVIPARFASTRLPGKPLLPIAGKPLIQHVFDRACESGAEEIIIATDDNRIAQAAAKFGAEVCMTRPDHQSGTDRLAEVAEQFGWENTAIVVNLQGDEPLMPARLIRQVATNMVKHPAAGITTLCMQIHDRKTLFTPDVVKVVMDSEGYALYFSRSAIPFHRAAFTSIQSDSGNEPLPQDTGFYHHLGLYAYRAEVLRRYPTLATCQIEQVEALEQLRALWHGIRIHVDQAAEKPLFGGVDTEHDLHQVSRLMAELTV